MWNSAIYECPLWGLPNDSVEGQESLSLGLYHWRDERQLATDIARVARGAIARRTGGGDRGPVCLEPA